jgi:hypothetical protein
MRVDGLAQRRSGRPRALAAALTLAAALPLVFAAPVAATSPDPSGINFALPTGFTVSGKVTNAANAGLGGIDVQICQDSLDFCAIDTQSTADGTFTLRGAGAGTYFAQAIGDSPRNLITSYYAGSSSTTDPTQATSFVVSGNTTGINIQLAGGLTVSGTVTDGTNPVANVEVDISGQSAGNAKTDPSGHYVVGGLSPGFYTTLVRPTQGSIYIAGYVAGGTVVEGFDGEQFELSGDVTGRDVTLVSGNTLAGHISGLVRPATVSAVNDFSGYALDVAPNGDFSIPALWPDVPVQLDVAEGQTSSFDEQFPVGVYDGTSTLNIDQSAAVDIDMSGGDVHLTLTAPSTPSVQGHVTGADSLAVHGWINLCGTGGCGTSTIGADGAYAFWNLPDDTYTLFVVSFDHEDGYVTATGVSPNQGDADPIAVSGSDVTRDVVVPAGYTISGRVTGPTGTPVANANVSATHTSHEFGRSAVTDSAGYYTIRGLRPDDYVVGANGPVGSDYIQGEHYWSPNGLVSDFDAAGVITLPATTTFITGTSPSNTATGVSKSVVVSVQFSDDVLGVSGTTIRLHPLGSTKAVTASVTYDATHHVASLAPKSKLHGKTTYVLEVSGITDTGSVAIPPISVQFTTSK